MPGDPPLTLINKTRLTESEREGEERSKERGHHRGGRGECRVRAHYPDRRARVAVSKRGVLKAFMQACSEVHSP